MLDEDVFGEDWMLLRRRQDVLSSLGDNEEIDIDIDELKDEMGENLWLFKVTLIRKYPADILDKL